MPNMKIIEDAAWLAEDLYKFLETEEAERLEDWQRGSLRELAEHLGRVYGVLYGDDTGE